MAIKDPSRLVQHVLLPLLVFSIISIILMYPVSLHPGQMINGRPFEDAFEYIWYLFWYKHALLELGTSPLFQPNIFYPEGWNLVFAAFPPIYPTLAVPFTAILGEVLTYNLFILATCIFAAYGAYLLAKALGSNQWGGIFAGVGFAFFPQRAVYFGGHLNFLTGSMWLPWLFFGLLQAKQKPAARSRWMAFAGLSLAMSIAGSWHFVFISTISAGVFALILLWPEFRRGPGLRAWARPIAVFVGTAAVIIGPFLLNAAIAHRRLGGDEMFSFSGTNASAVSLERFFVPSAINPLFWNLARQTFPLTNGQDGVVMFGYVVILAVIVALIRLRPWTTPVRALVGTAAITILLMTGPMLHWWGNPIAVKPPGAETIRQLIPELALEDGAVGIPMPALALYRLVPPFRTFHSFSRWGLPAALALSALAGLGITYLMQNRRSPVVRALMGIVPLMILLFEFNTLPLPDTTNINDIQRGVDDWLASQPEQSVIIEFPLSYTLKGQTLYYTIEHGQKIVHGAGSIFPTEFAERLPVLNTWPSEGTVDLLTELGVRYVVVHSYQPSEQFEAEALPAILLDERIVLLETFDETIGPIQASYIFGLAGPSSAD